MIEAAVDALAVVLRLDRLAFIFLGTGIGLMVGIIPGLGGVVGMSVLLPLIFGMDPITGIAMLVALTAVTQTADTFASVLLGVPGTSGSQATILDGYAMSQQGRSAEALGAGFSASILGGLFGAFSLFVVLWVARPIILAFGSPELFMLSLLGISMVAILSRGATVRGLIAASLGMLLSSAGVAPMVADFRFTFGSFYLYSGYKLALIGLGLFAIPELIDLLVRNTSISRGIALSGSVWDGVRSTLRNKPLVLRSSGIGTIVGIIPGLGGSVVDWIAYGTAKQTIRGNTFGDGDVRGVIAPESANNAKEGGALVPTILFGIPGSSTMAVFLGGLVLMNVTPGPSMLNEDLDVTLSIVWSLAIANAVGAIGCLLAARQVAKLTSIPAKTIGPFLIVVFVFAAYQSSNSWVDVAVFLTLGTVGWVMKEAGWPRPPLLVGFVLGGAAERYLWISAARYGWTWLSRPGVISIGLLTLAILVWGFVAQPGKSTDKNFGNEELSQ